MFFKRSIEYLGYRINEEGIRPSDSHIVAIREYSIPKDTHELHRFIGLASFFRRFVKNFSNIAAPLYSLLKKDATFNFGERELKSFETIQQILS